MGLCWPLSDQHIIGRQSKMNLQARNDGNFDYGSGRINSHRFRIGCRGKNSKICWEIREKRCQKLLPDLKLEQMMWWFSW